MSAQNVLFDALGPRGRRRILVGNVVAAVAVTGIAVWVLMRLADKGQLTGAMWQPFLTGRVWGDYIVPGLTSTLKAAGLAIVGSLVLGLLLGLGRLAPLAVVRAVSGTVVEFFRAIPVLLMMIFFWLGLARVEAIPRDQLPLVAVVLALVLYNGSVVAELVRSGVHGLPRGQREAALATGLTHGQSLRSVEVPQALIAMLPSVISQLVVILKDTALGYIITYPEMLSNGRRLGVQDGNVVPALIVIAVVFIVINYTLTWVAGRLSRRLGSRTSGTTRAEAPALIVGTATTR
ncbi:ABC transporter permease subunit [Cellulomonas aerilata]|uniref:Glutamate ABC transporter permease n=1 Tax=Cellulomonas aerilata TaxID=515326 RepID=A0A512DGQ0_9CELL|nr:ABC transporter permease subunit [Cellulomonas aerilata]GEO35596.1 glutamate ABC transporter permease [Cellulomonas aerilata]